MLIKVSIILSYLYKNKGDYNILLTVFRKVRSLNYLKFSMLNKFYYGKN